MYNEDVEEVSDICKDIGYLFLGFVFWLRERFWYEVEFIWICVNVV